MDKIRRPTKEQQEYAARKRRLALNGLQAVLIGGTLADQLALQPAGPERRTASPNERAFFNIRARYGAALDRLDGQLEGAKVVQSGIAAPPTLLAAIGSRLSTIQVEPQFQDDPGPADAEDIPDGPGAPDTPAEDPAGDKTFFDYPADVREAAQTYFDANTRPALDESSDDIVRKIRGGGGGAGGRPPFINDQGDLDIDQINDVLTGVAVVAALGVGGAVGAALAAFLLIEVPRMLAAIEDEIGDLLIGTFPD